MEYNKILIHTGNILDREELVRKVGQTTLQELHASIKSTLNLWADTSEVSGDALIIRGQPDKENLIETNEGLKTTVKVFMSTTEGYNLSDAILTVKKELDVDVIDSVIIMPPDVSDDLTLSSLKPAWKMLEAFANKAIVKNLGIAEICPALLKELYEWAEVKPSIIQINVSSCCTISDELAKFANETDVQILTHYDDSEVINEEIVETILSRVGACGAGYEVKWMARHRAVQTCYGLVADKGYSLALELRQQ